MKRSLVVFVALGLLAGLVGCSDSSDEIAELRAELNATKAELADLKAGDASSPSDKTNQETTDNGFPTTFGNGTWEVGVDIEAGTYASSFDGTDGAIGCYWQRVSGFEGTLNEVIVNEIQSGNVIVTILPSDKGFKSQWCEDWVKQ